MADASRTFSFAGFAKPVGTLYSTCGHSKQMYGQYCMVIFGTAHLSNAGHGSVGLRFLTNTAPVKCEHQLLTGNAGCPFPRVLQG